MANAIHPVLRTLLHQTTSTLELGFPLGLAGPMTESKWPNLPRVPQMCRRIGFFAAYYAAIPFHLWPIDMDIQE
jgi:hypothetical protein|tara:strand:+ start:279 stop:500 length:222 start_codon:yes stop_codon:yes gene_type:complete